MKQTLGKPEKLKSRKQIDQLFKLRTFVTEPPVRLFYQLHVSDAKSASTDVEVKTEAKTGTGSARIQTGFSCSKKFFKQATRRNRVKRLLREAYRKQKAPLWELCEKYDCRLSLFWLYGHKDLPSVQDIDQKVSKLLKVLSEKLGKKLGAK